VDFGAHGLRWKSGYEEKNSERESKKSFVMNRRAFSRRRNGGWPYLEPWKYLGVAEDRGDGVAGWQILPSSMIISLVGNLLAGGCTRFLIQ
jgi:hypothetical protein